jgi:release factor glutamine methyltransferase
MPRNGDVWTVLSMLEWGTGYFLEKGITQPRLSIEWLLAEVLNCKRLDLYLSFDRPLSDSELEHLRGLVKRRALHEPLQYITGSTDFYNCRIEVNPSVLIPRPETEQLAELAIEEGKKLIADAGLAITQQTVEHTSIRRPLHVLDAGTGSGCIAIAIKKAMPDWDVTAIDISHEALVTARRNAENNGTDIFFARCDFFDPGLSGLGSAIQARRFDIIVSNPPYIRNEEMETLDREVREYEPKSALFHHNVPGVYNALRVLGERWLMPGGLLLAELNEFITEEFVSVFSGPAWQTDLLEDYANKMRFIRARLAVDAGAAGN